MVIYGSWGGIDSRTHNDSLFRVVFVHVFKGTFMHSRAVCIILLAVNYTHKAE